MYPPENAAEILSSPVEHHSMIRDSSFQMHMPDRTSSLSEESRLSDASLTLRVPIDTEEKKNVSSYILGHICLWVGFAAGAIRYLLKNG